MGSGKWKNGDGDGDRNVLPVLGIPVSLDELGVEVDKVAGEQEVVFGCDGHGVAHEGSGVEG